MKPKTMKPKTSDKLTKFEKFVAWFIVLGFIVSLVIMAILIACMENL